MRPAILQLTGGAEGNFMKDTLPLRGIRYIIGSYVGIYIYIYIYTHVLPVSCFARTDKNETVFYILHMYTSREIGTTALVSPVAHNLVSFLPRHSRANHTDATRPCVMLFHARYALRCSGSLSLNVWLSLPHSTISVLGIPVR